MRTPGGEKPSVVSQLCEPGKAVGPSGAIVATMFVGHPTASQWGLGPTSQEGTHLDAVNLTQKPMAGEVAGPRERELLVFG